MRDEPEGRETFSRYFFTGVAFRIALMIGVMSLAYGGAAAGNAIGGSWTPFIAAIFALAVGIMVALAIKGRWDPLSRDPS